MRFVLRRLLPSLRMITAGCLALWVPCSAQAGEWETTVEPAVSDPWREIAVGGFFSARSWQLHTSTTFAPFGTLATDGFRFRMGSGYGRYSYTTAPPAQNDCRYGNGRNATIRGRVSFADILAGYQLTYGRLTVKAFGGVAMDTQELSPFDRCNANSGRDTGFKAVVETWLEITPKIYASLDGNWTQAHEAYSARLRLGYRLWPNLSIGLEETAVGNIAGDQTRSGVFARYEWGGGEVAASAGFSGERFDYRDTSRDRAWGALNIMLRY
jgi:Cellulose biosynthesis protein BcsS